jgi:rRNA maturation protein Nop10
MKCKKCESYTMKQLCCGADTVRAMPPKFSIEDKYAHYRRKIKMQTEEAGLL